VSRAEERRQAWLEAQSEKINRNGMPTHAPSVSTRVAAEALQILSQPDPEPAARDHSTAAGTSHVLYGGNARERLERTAAKKRDVNQTPQQSREQSESDRAWEEWNENYRKRFGSYPPHGV
jgi:hypothetical protein